MLAERRPHPRRRLPRRFLPLALVALLVLLTPLSLLAASPFNDLTGGVHDGNIGLIYDAGITKGCVPNVSYCPTGNVTREEMASFLARTAGLGTNPPVVNAKTAQSAQTAGSATTAGHATSADTATTATTAGNAAQFGGQPPSAFVRTGASFMHKATAANTSGVYTVLDNPLTNGKPGLLLQITQHLDGQLDLHPICVYYDSTVGRWWIVNADYQPMPVNAAFNVLVIQP